MLSSIRPPLSGATKAVGESVGLYHDGWIAPKADFHIMPLQADCRMVICGYTPEPDADTSTQVSVTIDSHVAQTLSVNDGSSEIEVNVPAEGTPIRIDVESRVSPEKGNVGDGDERDLAFVLVNVKVDLSVYCDTEQVRCALPFLRCSDVLQPRG
ncbi:hypothetical protein [Paraburkholderia terrae]